VGLAGQREAAAVGTAALQHVRQRLERLARLARAQVGLGQQLPRHQVARRALQRLRQVGLGHRVGAQPELGQPGEEQHARVVRHRLQQPAGEVARLGAVALQQRLLRLLQHRLGVVRRRLAQRLDLGLRLVGLALEAKQRDDGHPGRHALRVCLDHLAVRRQRAGAVALAVLQQLALQHAGPLVPGLESEHVLHQQQRAVDVALARLQLRLHDDRHRVARLHLQRRGRVARGLLQLALPRVRRRDTGQQVGRRLRLRELHLRVVGRHADVLAGGQQPARQRRQHLGVGHAELARLGELDHRRDRVARGEQGASEQQPARAGVGAALQQRLELDRGRVDVVLQGGAWRYGSWTSFSSGGRQALQQPLRLGLFLEAAAQAGQPLEFGARQGHVAGLDRDAGQPQP